jgi:hypothetical protein
MSLELMATNAPRPFDEEWRACLRAHYLHVVREVADGGAPTVNGESLRRVLIERAGFPPDEVDALYRQALGIEMISGAFVAEDAAPVFAAPVADSPSASQPDAAPALDSAAATANVPPAPDPTWIPDEPVRVTSSYDAVLTEIDLDALLATLSEDELLRDINEGEDDPLEAYTDGDATVGDVAAALNPVDDAPTLPDPAPELSIPSAPPVKQLALL